jgi:hypothetical protein
MYEFFKRPAVLYIRNWKFERYMQLHEGPVLQDA